MVALEQGFIKQNHPRVEPRRKLRLVLGNEENPLYSKFKRMTVLIPENERAPLEDHGPGQVSHEVIGAAVSGSSLAIAEMFETYGNRILLYCGRRIQTADYEDVAQNVWLNVCRHIESYEYQGRPFSSWLYTIARNQVISYHRGSYAQQSHNIRGSSVGIPIEDNIADRNIFSNPEQRVMRDAVAESIEIIIAGMEDKLPGQRDVLYWRYQRGLSVAETADIIGKTENNVKVLAYKGRATVRKELEKNGYHSLADVLGR